MLIHRCSRSIFLQVVLGLALATAPGVMTRGEPPDLLACWCHYDGSFYADIVARGYWYEPDRQSSAAFFPGHPLAAWGVARLFGWGA